MSDEVIFLNSTLFFSLLRSPDVDLTRGMFLVYKAKIPPLLLMDPHLCNQDILQKVTEALRTNPSLTLMHLTLMLDLKSVVTHAEALK